jgi:hypothetical protein
MRIRFLAGVVAVAALALAVPDSVSKAYLVGTAS